MKGRPDQREARRERGTVIRAHVVGKRGELIYSQTVVVCLIWNAFVKWGVEAGGGYGNPNFLPLFRLDASSEST